MNGFDQTTIERTYRNWAKVYEWLTPLYLLGNERRLRRETIASLHLKSGDSVLDIGCGTGRNFPLILEKIGSSGKLVGVDYTADMLARARKRIEHAGWKNVSLVQEDAASIELGEKFTAVLSTLAISVIPDYQGALERMLAHVKPEGRLAVADAKRSSRWYGRPLNRIADLLGKGAAGMMSRQPWEMLRPRLQEYHYQEWFLGFFYVVAGSVRG